MVLGEMTNISTVLFGNLPIWVLFSYGNQFQNALEKQVPKRSAKSKKWTENHTKMKKKIVKSTKNRKKPKL